MTNLIDKKPSWGSRPRFGREGMAADTLSPTVSHLVDTLNDKHAIGLSINRPDSYKMKNLLFRNANYKN